MEQTKKNVKPKKPKQPKSKGPGFFAEVKKHWQFYLMMVPSLLLVFVLNYLPMPGIVIAFKNYRPAKGIFGSEWAKPFYNNFVFFFKSDVAKRLTINTLSYNIIHIILTTVLSITVAVLLNELVIRRLPEFYKGVLIIPYFISWIVVQYVVFALLSVDRGIINNLIVQLGGTPIEWYSEPFYWRFIMPFAYLWKNVGYYSVLYVAAITGISPEYYEAAKLDGASTWQQITKITLPFLKPTIVVTALLWVGKLFNGGVGDWNGFYTITQNSGALYPATDVVDTYVYRAIRKVGDMGMPAAVGLFQSLIGLVLVFFSNMAIKKIDPESALF